MRKFKNIAFSSFSKIIHIEFICMIIYTSEAMIIKLIYYINNVLWIFYDFVIITIMQCQTVDIKFTFLILITINIHVDVTRPIVLYKFSIRENNGHGDKIYLVLMDTSEQHLDKFLSIQITDKNQYPLISSYYWHSNTIIIYFGFVPITNPEDVFAVTNLR